MKIDDVIERLQALRQWNNVVVEINGSSDHDIKDIYIDGKGEVCISIELNETYEVD